MPFQRLFRTWTDVALTMLDTSFALAVTYWLWYSVYASSLTGILLRNSVLIVEASIVSGIHRAVGPVLAYIVMTITSTFTDIIS